MTCHEMNARLADVLFEPEADAGVLLDSSTRARAEAEAHAAECSACRLQLDELRATMQLLDAWEAPAPNPYFLTRLNARLDEERAAGPASWLERMRARMMYGTRFTLRPVAAMAMSVVLLLSGGAYLGLSTWDQTTPPGPAPVVHDLQAMDSNAQLLDQLETLSNQKDD